MRRPIYLVVRKTKYLLASTFLRFQEYYESPRFRNKIFTWEEFMDWYARETGNFSYFSDWTGFNIPSRVLHPFYEGKFDPLLEKEREFLELFKDIEGEFYIIGVCDEVEAKDPALRHEFVHGLYHTDPVYRRKVREVFRKNPQIRPMYQALAENGYAPNVFDDEANSYLLSGLCSLEIKMRKGTLDKIRRQLREVFREHFGFPIARMSRQDILDQIHMVRM